MRTSNKGWVVKTKGGRVKVTVGSGRSRKVATADTEEEAMALALARWTARDPDYHFAVTRPVGDEEWGPWDAHGLSKHFVCMGRGMLRVPRKRDKICPDCKGDGMRRRPPEPISKELN